MAVDSPAEIRFANVFLHKVLLQRFSECFPLSLWAGVRLGVDASRYFHWMPRLLIAIELKES